jgi:hypothetical protein
MSFLPLSFWLATLTVPLGVAAQATYLSPGVPRELPAETADLSVRFRTLRPRLDVPGLRAHWAFDDASGYHALDASGQGRDAYLTGTRWNTTASGLTAALWRAGRRAGALHLDGTQRMHVRAEPNAPVPESISFGLWLRPERLGAARLLRWGGLELRGTETGTLRLQLTDANGQTQVLETPAALQPGAWRYLAATADGRTGTLRIFVDGELRANRQVGAWRLTPARDDLTIGQAPGEATGFAGMLDELSLFERVLTETELQTLYRVGLPKLYTQTRATLDSARTVWAEFGGNQPVPHPVESGTRLSLSFDETLAGRRGERPTGTPTPTGGYRPGRFGAALDGRSLGTPVRYATGLTGTRGSLEAHLQPRADGDFFRLDGPGGPLTLGRAAGQWQVIFSGKTISIPAEGVTEWPHLALVWDGPRLTLYLNGVARGQTVSENPLQFTRLTLPPGPYWLDDLRLSDEVKTAHTLFPHGQVATGAVALDPMDSFTQPTGETPHRWQDAAGTWRYAPKPWEDDGTHTGDGGTGRQALRQTRPEGWREIRHLAAKGFAQSIEAGVSLDTLRDGWAGVFVRAGTDTTGGFSGLTFALNGSRNEFRLATYRRGALVAERTVPGPFQLQPRRTYTLTLTATDGLLRGYLDGHNLVADSTTATGVGEAGLFTENTTAFFDDLHFSVLTPARAESRRLQTCVWAEGGRGGFSELRHTAFQWQKRPGLLPWAPRGKDPEPPGNLFGPTTSVATPDVERPNPTADWRSEDAANSDVLVWNGRFTYVMRGNPDHGGPHGLAALGTLARPADRFDGLHFTDVPGPHALLRGHPELSPDCADAPPRADRYQLNDQGMTVVGNRILVLAREFRNRTPRGNRYKRLVYALLDPATGHWQTPEPRYADWSVMNAADCFDTLRGLDATPEIFALREPGIQEEIVFLNMKRNTPEGVPTNGVVGMRLDGDSLRLHPGYPARDGVVKRSGDRIYGQRILFDNGIYYLHVNAGSTRERLARDWPDRFELYAALDPYAGPWADSRANADPARPYFTRGGANDPDNGAIWQGTMLKYRNRYYLYYENFHVIENTEQAYDHYDAVHSGSRVGFATAN